MKTRLTAAAALAAVALVPSTALGSPAGDLDPSFDRDGKRVLLDAKYAAEVLEQEDGKILVVIDTPSSPSGEFRVIRLNSDGTRDRGYGNDGVATADFGGLDRSRAAALQPDGKLVVGGDTTSASSSLPAVARFTTSGSLDPQFDPGGTDGDGKKVVVTPSTASLNNVRAVLVQPNGKIVLAGPGYSGKSDMAVVRLNDNGSADNTTFDRGQFAESATFASAALAPGGRIIVAGTANVGPGGRPAVAVARYDQEGTLDKTFGGTGKVTFSQGDDEQVAKVLAQPDGKVITVGAKGSADSEIAVTRFNADGKPDASFDGDGRATGGFDGLNLPQTAALQADGKIVLGGLSVPPSDLTVWRLQSNGAADPSFGSGGQTSVDFGLVTAATALTIQRDGRPVVAGTTQEAIMAPIARLQADPPPAGGPSDPATGGDAGPGSGPGSGGSAGDQTVVDRDAPVIGRVTLTRNAFTVSRRATPVAAAAGGTTIRYTLSEPAAVTLRLQRSVARRGGGRRFVAAGTLRRTGVAGSNKVPFSGRIGRRALRPGAYRVVVKATDAAGNRSASRTVKFKIKR